MEGFETDWRDAYPGVNAVTLMEIGEGEDSRQFDIFPVVKYSVKRRLETRNPDYWDFATLLELHVIAEEKDEAEEVLPKCLVEVRESWEPETTVRNLNLLREAKTNKGINVEWVDEVISELKKAAQELEK